MDWSALVVLLLFLAAVALGLSPVLLPPRVRLWMRWCLGLALFAGSLWYNQAMSSAPHPFHLILLGPFWLTLGVGLLMVTFHRSDMPR